jgi:hypothetical protein
MAKLWKGLVLGALVGAGIKAVQEMRGDRDLDQVLPVVAKTAGEAALAGAAIGLVLDRRDRRRRRKVAARMRKTGLGGMVAGAGAFAEAARPVLEHAAEVARERALHAADAARPHVEHAAEVARERALHAADAARPHVEHAAETAREQASRAAERARPAVQYAADAARPHVEHAADAARMRAARATEAARARLSELDLPVVVAV